jgi:predicted DCC family thiol-disulfide oxidoreductase YuxK
VALDLILYDGVCGLCSRMVQFVLRRDHAGHFRFASLQSAFAAELLARHGRVAGDLDTVYLVQNYGGPRESVLAKSRAVLGVARRLSFPWSLVGVLRVLPAAVLDRGYDQVARRRYRWFGRYDACPLPAPGARARFLDASG